MTPATVSAHGVGRTFPDGTIALHPTDLEVAAGETLVLLGPSGCGKTTMLRILSGLDRPDPGGRVAIAGEDVTDKPIEKRGVGMVFQSYALFPNMTVAENIAYGPRLKGASRHERRAVAERYMRLTRIEALGERRITQLSGGQRQRVALARALAAEPRAIFLDEPLAALDAGLRDELREEINALLRSVGVTAVYVTHDQQEAMALADRLVVMNAGRILQIGAPRDVYDRPATRFVAEFVGETNVRRLPSGLDALYRPEAMTVTRSGAGVAATVTTVTYLGATSRLTMTTEAGPVRTILPSDHGFAPGEACVLAFDETRAMVFAD